MEGGAVIAAVSGILCSLIVALFGSSWVNRRNNATLTTAQAASEEAKTAEITDRMARGWLALLQERVDGLEADLAKETLVRRVALAYIERLLDWIAERNPEGIADLPIIPVELIGMLDQ